VWFPAPAMVTASRISSETPSGSVCLTMLGMSVLLCL
jgi:hypothetical protein